MRAILLAQELNEEILIIPMIETQEAIDNIDRQIAAFHEYAGYAFRQLRSGVPKPAAETMPDPSKPVLKAQPVEPEDGVGRAAVAFLHVRVPHAQRRRGVDDERRHLDLRPVDGRVPQAHEDVDVVAAAASSRLAST